MVCKSSCQDSGAGLDAENQLSREERQSEKNGSRQGIAIFIFSNNNNLNENDFSVMFSEIMLTFLPVPIIDTDENAGL